MTMLRKALTAGAVVLVLASLPSPLAAQPKTTTRSHEPSAADSLAAWVHHLFNLIGQAITPIPLPKDGPITDMGCTVDPNGSCKP
jgi:hypothetical protein